jgi:hypothetical protein
MAQGHISLSVPRRGAGARERRLRPAGPYTGVADGRVVFWDGKRWVPFTTASLRWTQELCSGPKASLLEYLPTPGDGALHLTPVLRPHVQQAPTDPAGRGSRGSHRAGISPKPDQKFGDRSKRFPEVEAGRSKRRWWR